MSQSQDTLTTVDNSQLFEGSIVHITTKRKRKSINCSVDSVESEDDEEYLLDESNEADTEDSEELVVDTGVVDDEEVDCYGVPKRVKYSSVGGGNSAKIWEFYRVLHKPINSSIIRKKNSHDNKPYTHLCILCLKDLLLNNEDANKNSWLTALFKPTTSTHVLKHIEKCHPNHPDAIAYLNTKKKTFDKAVSVCPSTTSGLAHSHFSTSNSTYDFFKQASPDSVKYSIFSWLVYENIPFNTISSPYYKAMFTGLLPKYTSMSRDTFISYLVREFDILTTSIKKVIEEEKKHMYGLPFISICHDMWTTLVSDSALGTSMRFISKDFKVLQFACALFKSNESHKSVDAALNLKNIYKDRYCIDIDRDAKYLTSDTTASARAVSNFIDGIEQVDCEMHVVNLALQYAIGLRENMQNKQIVTPGGAFTEGLTVVKQLRLLANYFKGSPKRKNALEDVQRRFNLPLGIPALDGFTRVASCHKLLQTSILHYYAMKKLYTDDLEQLNNSEFVPLFASVSEQSWLIAAEMESLTSQLVNYAQNESQIDRVTAATIFFYRYVCEKYSDQQSFKILDLHHRPSINTMITNFPREPKDLEDFTNHGKICNTRLKEQLKLRFKFDKDYQFLPVFLDPITCPLASKLIPQEYYNDTLLCFKAKHLEIYNKMHPPQDLLDNMGVNNDTDNILINTENSDNMLLSLDLEMDLEDLTTTVIRTTSDVANEIIEYWFEETKKIDWVKFMHVGTEKHNKDVVTSYWKICYGDMLRWFKEVGKDKFPTLAVLARCELGRMNNSGYQERVFSSANSAMGVKQAKMSFQQLEQRTLLFHNKKHMANLLHKNYVYEVNDDVDNDDSNSDVLLSAHV
jgi:hypothetical protein